LLLQYSLNSSRHFDIIVAASVFAIYVFDNIQFHKDYTIVFLLFVLSNCFRKWIHVRNY